jgi:signal peptidase I
MENDKITDLGFSGDREGNTETVCKEPWLAVILSKFWAGIGQIYAGRMRRGCVLILVEAALLVFAAWCVFSYRGNIVTGVVVFLVVSAIGIWNLFDAHKCARRQNGMDFEATRKAEKDPWLAVFLSSVIPGLGQLYIRKRLWGIVFILCWVVLLITKKEWLIWVLGFEAMFVTFVCYHAYASSPVRREGSKRLGVTIAGVILVLGLWGYTVFPMKEYFVEAFRHHDVAEYLPEEFKKTGGSMAPTFQKSDRVLVKKSGRYKPRRGDIVVFKSPVDGNMNLMKRVAALGGESVEIKDGSVYINGEKMESPRLKNIEYVSTGKFGVEGEAFEVPADSLFVLGDNSVNSRDSREFGAVAESDLIGRAYKIYWPPGRMGPIE